MPSRRSTPHILLVMADQLSARALPSYGNRTAVAPNLTRLGDDGVVFERVLRLAPLRPVACLADHRSPSLPHRGVRQRGGTAVWLPTLAHRLRVRGYRTVLIGKMHFIGPDQLHGFEERPMTDIYPAGFDWMPDWELDDEERLPWYHDLSSVLRAGPVRATLQLAYDAEVLDRASRVIAEAGADTRPLFLVVSFTHPHDPYEVPQAQWDRYEGVAIPAPVFPAPPDPSDPPTRRLRTMVRADDVPVTPDQILQARRGYYGAVSLVDDYVGALLRGLDEHGLAEQTVTVVTSDHGDMLGERGLWYKMAPFEDSIRVPLIVDAPTSFEPRRVTEPVSLLDLVPTLVDLTSESGDTGSTAALDGVSLAEALESGRAPRRDVPIEYLAEGVRAPQVTLIRDSLKLIGSLGEPDLAYDVETDPGERSPLPAADEVEALRAASAARWNLEALDREVRASQRSRRLGPPGRGRHALRGQCRLHARRVGQQRLRVRGLGSVEHVVDAAVLDDRAPAHHGDLLGDGSDQRQVVRDEEQAELHLTLQLGDQVDDRRLDGDVERRGDLVADEQRRLGDERARDRDALALAAAQLVRVPRHDEGTQPHTLEGRRDAVRELPVLEVEEEAQRLADDLPDRLARVERVVRALEDVLEIPPRALVAVACAPRKELAVERDLAGEVAVQARDAAGQRRLAGARLADQRQALARLDRQVDVEQHLPRAVRGVHSAHLDQHGFGVRDLPLGREPALAHSGGLHFPVPEAAHLVTFGNALDRRKRGRTRIDSK